MISKNTIDKVFEQSRVEEVIGDFVQLKKTGSNYKALSPFSNEKTPQDSTLKTWIMQCLLVQL